MTRQQLEAIFNKHIKEIPYEGTEVNKMAIIDEIMDLQTSEQPKHKFIDIERICVCREPNFDANSDNPTCRSCGYKMF